VGVGGGAEVDRQHAFLASLGDVERGVGRDPVQPRAQRAAALEAVERLPGAQHRVLQGILGVVGGAEHPVAVRLQLAAVGLDEPLVGALVAVAGGAQQPTLRGGCGARGFHRFAA
jgi:hypothetical protein